ncbi:hypothetical protein DFH09DRAFT_1458310 [Mycena vulgaris]|nr:hypothetical protein DFH09DRAFT_1458310 [Mycena vulgaris]
MAPRLKAVVPRSIDPGLVFYGVGDVHPWGDNLEDVFVRLSVNAWFYLGIYRIFVSHSLTAQEWKRQSPGVSLVSSSGFHLPSAQFNARWCKTIIAGGGGNSRALRINVGLHRRLKRPPTAAETNKALHSSNGFLHLTESQIALGFKRGAAKLAVWTMKCVGYRPDFQRNIGRILGWARNTALEAYRLSLSLPDAQVELEIF